MAWISPSLQSLSKAGLSSQLYPPPSGIYQAMTPCTPGLVAPAHRLPQLQYVSLFGINEGQRIFLPFTIPLWCLCFLVQSLLGSTRNPWSATTPFGSSIWSTSADSALHPFAPSTNPTTLTDLINSPTTSTPAPTEMSRTYNPWSMWRPTLSRRSSEPWPSSSDNGN